MKNFLFLPFLILGCFACEKSTKIHEETILDKNPVLLVIGYDKSETFKKFPPLTSNHLTLFGQELFNSSRSSTLAVTAIGDPNDDPFLRINFQVLPLIPSNLSLRSKAKLRKKAKEFQQSQFNELEDFSSQYQEFVDARSEKNTDLNGFIKKAKRILNEPQFKNYQKYLLVYSDGYHDLQNHQKLQCDFITSSNLKLCLVGWKNNQNCESLNTIFFESLDGFTNYFSEQIK